MLDPSLNEEVVVRYLLGELPEAEADRLDEFSVTNDEFAEFLETVENELVDDYVRGELSEHNRHRFESHYLALPERREKVAVARAFLKRADQAIVSHSQQLSTVRRINRWTAIAAALALLALGGYLLLANIRLRNDVARMKEELEAAREREQQSRQAEEQETNREPAAPAALFAMTLSPQRRDVADVPEFTVPPKTEIISVTLQMESDDFPSYDVVLRNPAAATTLWQGGGLKRADRSIVVEFPAKLVLRNGDYILELFGKNDGDNPVIISGYPFYVSVQ